MSWHPAKTPFPAIALLRRHRACDRAARPRSRRLRGAPRAALGAEADGRAVHLLRPDGAGRVPDRQRHRRAPASAHRARHGHLSVRGRDDAPRQPRHLGAIRPGEVNLMTAGRGIVHSERERGEVKQSTHRLFGIQAWAALPKIARGGGAGLRPSRAGRAAAHHRRGQARAPRHGERLRRALAGRVPARELVCRSRAGAGRGAAARSRLRRAGGLRGLGRDRHRRRHVRRGAAAGVQARRPHLHPGATRSRA